MVWAEVPRSVLPLGKYIRQQMLTLVNNTTMTNDHGRNGLTEFPMILFLHSFRCLLTYRTMQRFVKFGIYKWKTNLTFRLCQFTESYGSCTIVIKIPNDLKLNNFKPCSLFLTKQSITNLINFICSLLQDVSNSSASVCESSVIKKKLSVTWGQSVHLSCFVKMPQVLSSQTVTWYHYSKEKGRYQIVYRYCLDH